MYKAFKTLDLPSIDQEILKFWEEEAIFDKSIQERPEDNTFVFYEGPPSANGMPGIHHVMARTIKDLVCRFHTMKGKRVLRKGGWDTHGLPIELNVEKELGITKIDIGTKISIEEYNRQCRSMVMRYKDKWDDITRKMGYWVDLEHPYITFEDAYIESVWWLLKQLFDKDMLYKGYTIQPYSPAAGTGLSSHELNQPGCYRDVKDTTVVAQFKVVKEDKSMPLFKDIDKGEVYFIAWTTTPWTLPSNTALAVGKKIDYVLVGTYNPYTLERVNLILAEELLHKWFKPEQGELEWVDHVDTKQPIPYKVLVRFKGKELEGIRYEQLMPYTQPEQGDAFRVIIGDFVTTSDGTGIVHIAPSFGADDKRVAAQNGIGALTLVDKEGKFVDVVSDYAGRYVKDYKDEGPDYQDVNIDIAVQLKKENKAFNVQRYVHNYPHCWRTDKPILYYPLDSWFVRTTAAKERLVELNKTINWKPTHTGEKRFGHWLENLQDWNLSRSRYWGIPLPIWRTEDATETRCIGSKEELKKAIEEANAVLGLSQTMPDDLHRPYIDQVVLVSRDGREMKRELDLIDVWFDSGSMPYAQWHYPFENKEVFERNFPADFIAEGVDQTRGWFFTLHAIAGMVFDSVAYKNVMANGLVLDKNGLKMSKRLGNAVDPFETLEKYGADATRWYMISNAPPWDNLKFDIKGVDEVKRKFFGTLYNTYSFFVLYANIDGFDYSAPEVKWEEKPELDRWILSSLHTLIKKTASAYEDYEPTTATRLIQDFVDGQLSNWYVRLSRRRFWKGEMSDDKRSAYQTLYTNLVTLAKLIAPVAPFFSEWLYRNLNTVTGREPEISVHLSLYPKVDEKRIDPDLERRMDYAQRISSLVLSLRKRAKIRVRQPLQKILIPVLESRFESDVRRVEDIIKAEVNIKEIRFISGENNVIQKVIKPNFKTLGRRLGKQMKEASKLISNLDQAAIASIEQGESYFLEINGERYELTKDDFVITSSDIPGWSVATDREITVALDVTLTPELEAEGMARELINRIQNLRKSKDFDVTDKIVIRLEKHPTIIPAIEQYADYIKREVLATSLELTSDPGEADKIDLPGDISLSLVIDR